MSQETHHAIRNTQHEVLLHSSQDATRIIQPHVRAPAQRANRTHFALLPSLPADPSGNSPVMVGGSDATEDPKKDDSQPEYPGTPDLHQMGPWVPLAAFDGIAQAGAATDGRDESRNSALHLRSLIGHKPDEEQPAPNENPWPALPDNLPEPSESGMAAQRAWARRQRLDWEQRGDLWNG